MHSNDVGRKGHNRLLTWMIESSGHRFTSVIVAHSWILRFQIRTNFSRSRVDQQIMFAGVLDDLGADLVLGAVLKTQLLVICLSNRVTSHHLNCSAHTRVRLIMACVIDNVETQPEICP